MDVRVKSVVYIGGDDYQLIDILSETLQDIGIKVEGRRIQWLGLKIEISQTKLKMMQVYN